MLQVALHGLRRQIVREFQPRHPADSAPFGFGQRLPRGHHVVGNLGINVLERIPRLQRRVRLVGPAVCGTLVLFAIDPYPTRGVLDRNLESKLRSRGLQNAPRDLNVDELGARREDPDCAPLPGRLEGAAQQSGRVVALRLADLGVDAFLGQLLLVLGQLLRDPRVEGLHPHVQALIVRDLAVGLYSVDPRDRLRLPDDAGAHEPKEQ